MGAELFHADKKTHRRTDGRTDGNDEANNCFSQFFESASKLAEFPLPHMSSCHAMPMDKFTFFILTNYVMNHCFRHLGESLN